MLSEQAAAWWYGSYHMIHMIWLTVLKVIPEHLVINPLQISLNNFSSGDTLTLVSTPNRGQFLCSCPWLFNQTCPLHWTPYSRQNRFEITFVAIVGIMSKRSVIFELISFSSGIEWMIISSAACKKSDRNFCLSSFKKNRNRPRNSVCELSEFEYGSPGTGTEPSDCCESYPEF